MSWILDTLCTPELLLVSESRSSKLQSGLDVVESTVWRATRLTPIWLLESPKPAVGAHQVEARITQVEDRRSLLEEEQQALNHQREQLSRSVAEAEQQIAAETGVPAEEILAELEKMRKEHRSRAHGQRQ